MQNQEEIAPPELSFPLAKLGDVDDPLKEWKDEFVPIDILLVTAKDCEFLACYSYLENRFQSYRHGLGMVFFGQMGKSQVGKVKVALVRCYEGANNVRGSLITVKNAVTALSPKAVFNVGFAGALNSKVKLGDVVVSAKLTTYAHKKITEGPVEPRGCSTHVSRDIADLILHSGLGWKAPLKRLEVRDVKVHCDGEFLSGPELVDSGWRREELVQLYPNAIAIEMEGEGVYAAAADLKMEWVVIKGISDYADGTKTATGEWRPFASVMAASVVANILKNPFVFRDWPHYNATGTKASTTTTTASEGLSVGSPGCLAHGQKPNTENFGSVLERVLQMAGGSASGQLDYKGRTICYRTHGRIHSFQEPWVFDGTAWDVESGISENAKHYQESQDAVRDAVNKLIANLRGRGILISD